MSAAAWVVVPRDRDASGRIRWYSLRWTGARLTWLLDGFHSGRYRYKRDAVARAAELNK